MVPMHLQVGRVKILGVKVLLIRVTAHHHFFLFLCLFKENENKDAQNLWCMLCTHVYSFQLSIGCIFIGLTETD